MAKAKSTPTQTKGRSSPRLSAASAKSTPSRSAKKPSTPLKNNITSTPSRRSSGRWIEKGAKTSPYFDKSKGKGKVAQSKKVKGKAKVEEDEDGDSPSGLTESDEPSSSDDGGSEDDFDPSSSSEPEELIEEESDEDGSIDSEFLDEDQPKKKTGNKRKSVSGGGKGGGVAKKVKLSNGTGTGVGKGKSDVKIEGYDDEDEYDDEEIELEEGQEIAGRIYPAPKTGQVPPGRISQNTLNFLKNLQIPERNDREWFRSHEPSFRQAENEWKAFVGTVQMKFHEADDEVPILPPKDIIHRIYRDVRFSSDKTPYKRNFSMSTSRGGRKGIWAAYHLSISSNDKSLLAAGIWQPGKNELAQIRHHLLTDPQRFRDCISHPDFVRLFGEAKADKKGRRQNVFGNDDQLKVAPKGVEKDHKDIDLLKLRSIAVVHHFTDDEVISKDFQEQLYDVLVVMRPFVRLLNDYVTLPPGGGDDDDDHEAGDEEEGEAE
ncbi:hypothetical protein I203_100744 [Kwoniella mangroviensis CBS 8507]|uniref:uncharacterized protein n=1 Tax=Kwoniella mangroviensis CBS 8507 TaxID=1296122 RepID=UPI00080D5379|nr:uncharacterized protein I203_06723 [Kwoniella mangroviensis CBS 8507]OCF64139.1 hypothetical protein I203_06723 [Kwoniella mangroviensis CBS 8507]